MARSNSAPATALFPGLITIELTVNGVDGETRRCAVDDAARCVARSPQSHWNEEGLRSRPVRRLHVLVDRRASREFLPDACRDEGRCQVTTIEGLGRPTAHCIPLQQAFIDHDAFQCGYCTPGQICSAVGLIAEGRRKHADDIRELMSGNICRCGAYPNIVAAIQQAMRSEGVSHESISNTREQRTLRTPCARSRLIRRRSLLPAAPICSTS